MTRLGKNTARTGRRIAVVDDDPTLLESTLAMLAYEGHEVRGESDPAAAVELVRSFHPEVLLLDYYLRGGTGADVVRAVRAFDAMVQVLLVTGYASEQPARRMLAELDIQGYHDKADGPQRLLVLLDAALKHARALARIEWQRRSLRHILDASDLVCRLQPVEQLFRAALENVGALLDAGEGFVATENNGLLVMTAATEGVSVRAGTGRFAFTQSLSGLPAGVGAAALAGLRAQMPMVHEGGYIVIPFRTSDDHRGCLVLEGGALPPDAVEPCRIYARQISLALENVLLFQRATVDPLTELYNRGFGDQQLGEALAFADRQSLTTSVLMADIDRFKVINDTFGHSAGDLALRAVAAAIRGACRATTIVSRYGGEEFLVVMPATTLATALPAAERIRAAVEACTIPFEGQTIRATVSIGVAARAPVELDAAEVVHRADQALYQAKATGRNRVCAYRQLSALAATGTS